jgi:HAD superfamily hydrolase (TIGR01509 family)
MLKGIIFDMDGVIADSHPIHLKSWKILLSSAGVAATEKELDIIRDGRSKEELLRHFLGDLAHADLHTYAREKDRLYRENAKELTPVKGIRPLLEELKSAGITLGVASSGSYWRVNQTLDLLSLKDYFVVISTADEFKCGKSDPAIFRMTAQRMQVRCEQTLVFEDSATAIRSARSVCMKCLGIADSSRAETLITAGAQHVVPNFATLSLIQLQTLFSMRRAAKTSARALSCSN